MCPVSVCVSCLCVCTYCTYSVNVYIPEYIHNSAKWVKVDGLLLKSTAVVVLSPYVEASESLEFAVIEELFVLPSQRLILGVKLFEVIDYSDHLHSWSVKHSDTKRVVLFKQLCSPQLLHARTSRSTLGVEKFITLKYSVF